MGIQKTKMDKNVNSFSILLHFYVKEAKVHCSAWKQKCPKQQKQLYTFKRRRRRVLEQQQEVLGMVGQEYCYPAAATEAKI